LADAGWAAPTATGTGISQLQCPNQLESASRLASSRPATVLRLNSKIRRQQDGVPGI